MIQRFQTKPIISGVTGQEQLPVVKESRGPSSFFFRVTGLFQGISATFSP